MKRCFIYAAGTFYGLRERPREGELQIAADAGLHLCERLSVRPDVVLGVRDAQQMVDVGFDCHGLPHFLLRRAVLGVKRLFPRRQLAAFFF